MRTEGGRVSFTQHLGERKYYRENDKLCEPCEPKTCTDFQKGF